MQVSDIVVSESGDLHEAVNRTLKIRPGVTLTVHRRVSGTVEAQPGATLQAQSDVDGTVDVSANAEATLHSRMGGTLNVNRGGVATLAPSAIALGTMRIDGTVTNNGTRGVEVHGAGVADYRDGSTIRPPDETREDSIVVYYG